MRKDNFIKLTVKFIGLAFVLPAIGALITLPIMAYYYFETRDYGDPLKTIWDFLFINLSSYNIKQFVIIIAALYFLFYGKKAYRIIASRSLCSDDNQINLQESGLVIIRATGIWFFTKAIILLITLIVNIVSGIILWTHRSAIYEKAEKSDIIDFNSVLDKEYIISDALSIIFYIILSIYLLRAGKCFIRFLTRNQNNAIESNDVKAQPT